MKKIGLVLLALVLGGCVDQSTPEWTVKSIGYTIAKNKYKTYRGLFMGEAKKEFGTRQAFDAFRADAEKFKNAKVIDSKEISSEKTGYGGRYIVYEVAIQLDESSSALATVDCVESFGYSVVYPDQVKRAKRAALMDYPPGYPGGYPGGGYPPPYPEPERPMWRTGCQVSDINL